MICAVARAAALFRDLATASRGRQSPEAFAEGPKLREAGVRRRAERLYEQLDMLRHLRQQARRELLAESRKHAIIAKMREIPHLGPIRSALAVALNWQRCRPAVDCRHRGAGCRPDANRDGSSARCARKLCRPR